MQHRVVLGEHVHTSTGLGDAHQLGEDPLHVRHRLDHVPVGDQVESVVRLREVEGVAGLEPQARRERRVALARVLHGGCEQLDAEHLRLGQQLGDACAELAGARADVEHARIARQPVEIDERLFLRPDRFDLRGQRADHGFVRHLLALGIEC